jgi:hypothetical protein
MNELNNEFSTANYQTDGEWVIGGKLTILPDAAVTGLPIPAAANQANSTATDAAGLVTDFNALLAKLKAVGLMEADPNLKAAKATKATPKTSNGGKS